MLGQHHKFDVDLLSYFLAPQVKHCSQMNLKESVYRFVRGLFKISAPGYVLNLCSKTLLPWREVQKFFGQPFDYIFTIWH